MNKRKIFTLALSLMMVAILAVGGSLAYFMDTDNADNTFVIGDVSIVLNEQQRGDNGLEDFKQNKDLYPIVGSAQGEKDEYNLPTAKNYVDKVVTVTNDGKNEAYIRVYFAIPSALDDGYDTFNAGMNVLHFNFGTDANGASTFANNWDWMNASGDWNYFETTMNGIAYNVYFADYTTPVAAGATTERAINGVYLDSSVNFLNDDDLIAGYHTVTTSAGKNYQMIADCDDDGEYASVALDFDILNNGVTCPVFALGVQTAGFDTPDAAFDAAFGAQYNPWGTEVSNWQ